MTQYIYGKYPVSSFIQKYPKEVKKLWFSDEKHLSILEEILGGNLPEDLSKQCLSNKELRKKFSLKEYESHQGLVLELTCDFNELLYSSLENLIVESSHQNKIMLWLPSIQDTNNLGAVIRSCLAMKMVHGIIIPSSKSVSLTPAVAKISAGAIFDMKFASYRSISSTANNLKNSGIKLLSIEKSQNSVNLWDVDFKNFEPFVLVVGSEEKGIPESLRSFCDTSITIPQGEEIDSLNLSVATGIVLYEVLKQYSK